MDAAKLGEIQNAFVYLRPSGAIVVSGILLWDEPLFQDQRKREPGLLRCLREWPCHFLSVDDRSIRPFVMGAGL